MRKAFTLIEMMIAILLFSLMTLFLSSTLQSLHQGSSALNKKVHNNLRESQILQLLLEDIQESDSLQIIPSPHYISLELHTNSSIYAMSHAYVRWFVDPKRKVLLRSESSFKLSPPYMDEELHQVHLDETFQKLEWFKAYASKDRSALFISLNFENKNLFLEVLTPQHHSK